MSRHKFNPEIESKKSIIFNFWSPDRTDGG
jgi:hypothetical protein